jgi:DNA-binding Xre family transcriptional regulator
MTARGVRPKVSLRFAHSFSGQQRMAKRQKRVRRSARSVTDIDRQVAINIRQLRLERGLSQEKLAGAIGTSFQQLQKYETGKNRITIGRLASICGVLGVSLTDVVKSG